MRFIFIGILTASLSSGGIDVSAFSTTSSDHIKKAGAGVSIKSPGDLSIFDPNECGKLQGTNDVKDRIAGGAAYTFLSAPTNIVDIPPAGVDIKVAQHFLEYLDSNGELPLNFAKPQAPVTATVLGRTKLISDDAPGDIEHVIMKLPAGFHYVEGENCCRKCTIL